MLRTVRLLAGTLLVLHIVTGCSGDPAAAPGGSGGSSDEVQDAVGGPAVTAKPLPARKRVAGKRFAQLDPQATKLSFRNQLRSENTVAYVYMGAGVTTGDYDQDGWPDIYLVSQDGRNKLFRQVAPMEFEDVTATAGAGLDGGEAWGTAATFADVDGDADLDLYVCNLESPNLLFVNQGDGTFVEKAGAFGLGKTAASTGAAFADYDNDGDLDLYLLTNRVFRPTLPREIVAEATLPERVRKSHQDLLAQDLTFEFGGRKFMAGQQDLLFRNDGYANFVDVTAEAGLQDHGNGLSVVWWDFDDDGHQDLYVANDFQSPDQLYHNQGDGTFVDVTKERLPHTAFFGMGADFADISGDGLMDLCVADMSSTTHYMGKMLMGNMDQHRWFLMNSDPPQYMRNALYVSTGTERFLEAAHMAGLSSTDWTWTVRFADLDDDGKQDFYATNGIPVFADNPDIGNRVKDLWGQKRYAAALEVMRNMPRVDEKNIARRNLGGLKFEDVGEEWGLDENGVTHGAVLVDLDRDGDLDVVTNNLNRNASIFENRTSGAHRLLVELRGARGNAFGVGAKIELVAGGVTQVRQVSLTRGYMSGGEAVEHFGLGAVDKIDELRVTWPGGGVQVVRDIGVDQHVTIREVKSGAPRDAPAKMAKRDVATHPAAVHREHPFDDFEAQPLLPHRLSQLGPGAAVGVLPGRETVVWMGGAAQGERGVLRVSGLGGDQQPSSFDWSPGEQASCEDMGAVFLDFDADGDLDLFVCSGGVESPEGDAALRDRLYVRDGDGYKLAPAGVLPDLRTSSSCVAAADFDRDGDVDLFVGGRVVPGRYPHAPSSVLLRNDGGTFVDVTDELAPMCRSLGMVSSACWTDLDNDGFVDLAVAAQWQPVRVLRNDGGRRLEDRTDALGLGSIRGLWNAISSADLDGDGDFDLVVTNLGLNTKYKANAKKPMQLFARDFDGNGTMDVVEAKRSGDRTLPVRGLSCSSQAMPFVRKKFPTYDQFARAALGDIYGKALDESLSLSCNELRHVVFENLGSRFALRPLPRETQIAPSLGLLVCDVDGDGAQELVMSHNFWSPEPETGRFDGGLGALLRHREGLQFEVVPAIDGGLFQPGDGRGVALVAADAGAMLLFLRNDAAHEFRRMPAGQRSVSVQLAGPAGNPNGIGARIVFERQGQPDLVRELHAGDGYLTQSAPIVSLPSTAGTLRVRWPDGGETTHALTEGAENVTLRR